MPTKIKQMLDLAIKSACNCTDIGHLSLRHKHVAIISYKGRVLSVGYNHKWCSLRG